MSFRILVTGASGFIGSALVPALASAGHHVRAASRQPIRGGESIDPVELPDFEDNFDWGPLLAGIDIVIHLAAVAHRQGGDAVDYDKVNRGAAVSLSEACLRHPVRRLIFLSSIGAQTGSASDRVLTEDDEPHPVTGYDQAKLAAEVAIRKSGVPHTILRPVIVYGPNAKANIAFLVRIAALPLPLPLGSFHNRRSLLAIGNLVEAIMLSLDSPSTLNETFIAADPEAMSIAEIFGCLREADGGRARLVSVPPRLIKGLLDLAGRGTVWDRIGRDLVVNPAKLLQAGWEPSVTTREGLRKMISKASA
ncbi:UDP-sugar epimerase [Nitrobacter sp. Nb-311A]|uniref:NAD-dependent epimerase/dehydratase family protein n=1 Tax=Nitrobacter sp. Nb-311A TaxID=314253 RepID=UPI0000687AC6|nr:NAD-dependent epimerase/dehydratase family protein [Nitrobacter sp. Nb-311A]EAQ36414.1 UDP-sugar epimerase [Nitrobacter sp. Nb-311A]